MTRRISWDRVSAGDVQHALDEFDRLGAERFFAEHGFAPTTTYRPIWRDASHRPRRSSAPRTKFWPPASGSHQTTSRAAKAAPSES